MTVSLTRQQRRALERHAPAVDLVTASDRRWFEEHPHRRFRIRRMAAAEIASIGALKALNPVPDGSARFTLIRKMSPDCRLRIFIFGPLHKSGGETSEEIAAALWQQHLNRDPAARARELAIAAMVSDHDHRSAHADGGAG